MWRFVRVYKTTRKKKGKAGVQWPPTSFSRNSFPFFFSFFFYRDCLLAVFSTPKNCGGYDTIGEKGAKVILFCFSISYAGMRRMCASKQEERCDADTKGVCKGVAGHGGKISKSRTRAAILAKRNNFIDIGRRIRQVHIKRSLNSRPGATNRPRFKLQEEKNLKSRLLLFL